MKPVEVMRGNIVSRSHQIGSLMRAADLVMNQSGEPDPQKRATIALDLVACAEEYAGIILDTADAMEPLLIR
jgi:hypothetical protein